MTTLYIKTHNTTGLKYFGKTTKSGKEFDNYQGSGTYWQRHLKKHGSSITTEIFAQFEDNDTELVKTALRFSKENDIVDSSQWANLIMEDGKDGGLPVELLSEETRRKMSESKKGQIPWNKGKKTPIDVRKKQSEVRKGRFTGENNPMFGKSPSDETRNKLRDINLGKKASESTKKKMSEAHSGDNHYLHGKSHTKETKKKMSDSRKGRFAGVNSPRSKIIIIYDLLGIEICRGPQTETMKGLKMPETCVRYLDKGRIYADITSKSSLTKTQNHGNMKFCGWLIETLS